MIALFLISDGREREREIEIDRQRERERERERERDHMPDFVRRYQTLTKEKMDKFVIMYINVMRTIKINIKYRNENKYLYGKESNC